VRVLVLGGTGFIGGAAVRALIGRGHVVALFHRGEALGSVETIRGDRRELGRHREAFARFDPEIVVDSVAYTEADAALLVETFRGLARRAVVLSSQDVYAAYGRLLRLETGAREAAPLAEDAPLRGTRYPYRAKARGAEDMAHDYEKILVEAAVAGHAELPATILRLPFVYGPGDTQRRLRPYLERMRSPELHLDRAKAAWRWTRGYVEDVGEAIALATGDERAAGQIFNVGEEDALTEAEWVRAIGEAAGWRGELRSVPAGELPEGLAEPFDYSQDLAVDTRRIRSELGFREPVGRPEGLRRTVAWEASFTPASR
jgi:nucleoside-diphosphate-sugar epimerase